MRRDATGLPISLDVEGRRALVVGGGDEAEDKVRRLLDGGAAVTVVARDPGAAIESLAGQSRLTLLQRDLFAADVRDADLVLVCARDPDLAARAFDAASAEGAAIWCVDDPGRSDFAMPALVRAGRARIAVSTSGAAPALSSKIRADLERALATPAFARFVEQLAAERARLLAEEPDLEKRRAHLRALVDGFALQVEVVYPEAIKEGS